MSNDVYQQRHFFEKDRPICIQQDENGNCLMSVQFIVMDLSKPFCEQVKDKKNDKAIRPAGR